MPSRPRRTRHPIAPRAHRRTPHPSCRCPDSARRSPRPSPCRPDRATVLTAAVRSRQRSSVAMSPHRSPVAVVPRCRPRAGEPPVSSTVSRATVGCRCWVVVQRRALRGPTELGRTRCAGRGRVGRASAVSTGRAPRDHGLCARVAVGRAHAVRLGRAWFRPSGTRIRFIFSEYIQFLANSKICVGFI
jgi:hypothetical protein